MVVLRRRTKLSKEVLAETCLKGRKDIAAIHVKGLFGRFNYTIELEQKEKVSLIIAPNGCGKTTVFRLVNLMFNPSIKELIALQKVPFRSIQCDFNNGDSLKMTKSDTLSDAAMAFSNNTKTRRFNRTENEEQILRTSILLEKIDVNAVDNAPSYDNCIDLAEIALRATSGALADFLDYCFDMETVSAVASKNDNNIDDRLSDLLLADKTFREEIKDTLAKWNLNINLGFITANRLHRSLGGGRTEAQEVSTLDIARQSMIEIRSEAIREYNRLLSEAKDALPGAFIKFKEQKSKKANETHLNQLMTEWHEYNEKLKKYYQFGLISEYRSILDNTEQSDEDVIRENVRFMSVYIDLFLKTLEPLEKLYAKMSLFKKILDDRNTMTCKELVYTDEGFHFKVADGYTQAGTLPIEYMSSGEKNDFIMFFNLIFMSEDKDLILVDEPEISLHIEWQEQYLGNLCNICKTNGCLAIVATHSPHILNNREDLLKGLYNEAD